MSPGFACEDCNNYVYDEDEEAYICVQDMDEDDFYRVMSTKFKDCPYYRSGDEYKVVRHQM